jgi:hypothetical protein
MLTPDERKGHKVLFLDKAPSEYKGDYRLLEQTRKSILDYTSKVGYNVNIILGRPKLDDLLPQECIIWHSWHTDLLAKAMASRRMGIIQLTGSEQDEALPPDYIDGLVVLKKPFKLPALIECMDGIIGDRKPSCRQIDRYSSSHKPSAQSLRYQ